MAQDWEALGALWRGTPMPAGVDLRSVALDCLEFEGVALDDRPWRQTAREARLSASIR